MLNHKSWTPGRVTAVALGTLAAWLSILSFTEQAKAIPTFSRKYRTSCVTCHTVFPKLNDAGEAFRRNGYQFPSGEDILVKDEPVPLGSEAYKDMWPNSIWPSGLPTLPPIFIRAQQRMIFHTDPAANGKKWDQDYPHEVVLGGAGTFGKDISAWWEIEWEPPDIIDEGAVPNVERAFVQFSNLFAYDEDEDEDGMHQGNRWLVLPRHAMNLRIGKMEPQVLPHWVSQHGRVAIEQPLPVRQRIGDNKFRFEPAQSAAVELNGIIKQYNSYAVGFANGGVVSGEQLDDNNYKDVYFRVAHKWFGYPFDGVLGAAEPVDEGVTRGQSPDDDAVYSPGLDFWRAWGLETGFFGWWGRSDLPAITHEQLILDTPDPLPPFFAFKTATITDVPGQKDFFRRIGADARLQWSDLDLYGLVFWGHDSITASDSALAGEDLTSYIVQADYMFKPWILGYLRYEQTFFSEAAKETKEEARLIPGAVFLVRQNMKLQAEWVFDTTGMDTGGRQKTDQLRFQLDYAY